MRPPLPSIAVLVLLCAALAAAADAPAAPPATESELRVKCAILFNTARFVRWPEDVFTAADAPIVIGIVGTDPFGGMFDERVAGKIARGRTIRVVRVAAPDLDAMADDDERAAADGAFRDRLRRCQILYVSRSEKDRFDRVLAHVDGRPVLTVSDVEGFAVGNGMVELTLKRDGRIGLLVNRGMLERARLHADAKFLDLARIVESRNPPPPPDRPAVGRTPAP